MKADLTAKKEKYTTKVMHGYYERKSNSDTQIDKHLSNYYKKDKFVTSQLENYLSTIQDQELPTKYLRNKRAHDSGKSPDCDNKCRLCTTNAEDISHIIASCSLCLLDITFLSDNEVAKSLLNSHLKNFYPSKNITFSSEFEYIYKENSREYWWNVPVKRYHIINRI